MLICNAMTRDLSATSQVLMTSSVNSLPSLVTKKCRFRGLHHRKESKTFGEAGLENPIDFEHWGRSKQVHWLIEQLFQFDALQEGQPGGVELASDWRV